MAGSGSTCHSAHDLDRQQPVCSSPSVIELGRQLLAATVSCGSQIERRVPLHGCR